MSDSPILLDYTESDGEEATLPGKAVIPARKAPSSITMLPRIPKKKQKQPLEDELDETVKAKKREEEEKGGTAEGARKNNLLAFLLSSYNKLVTI
ncbi:hypothetical protein B9Z55_008887 [Caenorhabditis nigoni]|uniref:Uncharacterized protein n=1 Tax=Caenorhabditis nigoni TaxID=1611254 RepID=A0A2G5UPQ9_9PELO|nr:hypothetical protein B9Z55_008887 [Caenorhabditis nigoni]